MSAIHLSLQGPFSYLLTYLSIYILALSYLRAEQGV